MSFSPTGWAHSASIANPSLSWIWVATSRQGKRWRKGKGWMYVREGRGKTPRLRNKFLATAWNTIKYSNACEFTALSCFWTVSSLLLASESWLCACVLSFCIWVMRFCSTNTSSTCWQHKHQYTPLEMGPCHTLKTDLLYDIDTTFSKYRNNNMFARYFLVRQCWDVHTAPLFDKTRF